MKCKLCKGTMVEKGMNWYGNCDTSTLTELDSVYCNKLQISIQDYKDFSCSKWSNNG